MDKKKPKRPTGVVKPEGYQMPGSARHFGPKGMRALQQFVDSTRPPNKRGGKR